MTRKLFTLAIFATFGICSSFALSRERASAEADFLTDKMAYELGLTEAQWADVYEINYDYFRVLDRLTRSYSYESQLRDEKLRYVLTLAQWQKYRAISYFMIPAKPGPTEWIFSIYAHYHHNKYFYDSRRIVDVYRGSHHKNSHFYQERYQTRNRPVIVVHPNNNHSSHKAPAPQHGKSHFGGPQNNGHGVSHSKNGGRR